VAWTSVFVIKKKKKKRKTNVTRQAHLTDDVPSQADTHGRVNQPLRFTLPTLSLPWTPLEGMLQGSSVHSSPGNNVHIQ
jgi:hypothetical protein